jgi:hypothetical protein
MISTDALHKVIDASQLTQDLEGTLHYDHSVWIELRCVSDATRDAHVYFLEHAFFLVWVDYVE